MNNYFIVIPCYNESAMLGKVIDGLIDAGYPNIIVVDDGSEEPLSGICAARHCHYLRHAVNLGQGAALQTGIEYAVIKNADVIITFDADGQHDPADIAKMAAIISQDKADIVLGSRFTGSTQGLSFTRKMVIKTACFIQFLLSGFWMTDAHNGIRAISREAAKKIHLTENRMAHATEIILEIRRHKLRWVEVPVHIVYSAYSRKKGQKTVNSIRILFDVVLHKLFR